jgi:N-acetylglutamate synthase-like GNAT family acetyltransferase
MAVRIREATAGDAPAVAALLVQLGYPQDADALPARLAAWERDPASRALVADVGGAVAGVVAVHACPYLHRDGRWARIAALVVADDQRRGGVGRALLDAAHAAARELGCGDAEVTSSRSRDAAHAFYAAAGYEEVSDRSARYRRVL